MFDLLTKSAQKLSKNPLGIIALFIVFIYAIASLVLVEATTLENYHKTIMIWFLVLFPVLVLCVFAWLVKSHHRKLYGPGDYRSDDAFLRAASPDEIREKYKLETEFSVDDTNKNGKGSETIRTMVDIPKITGINAQEDYLIAEDLIMKELENKYNTKFYRDMVISVGSRKMHIDGLADINDNDFIVEVKYIRDMTNARNIINSGFMQLEQFSKYFSGIIRGTCVLAIAIDGDTKVLNRYIEELKEKASKLNLTWDVLTFNLNDLKSKWVISN